MKRRLQKGFRLQGCRASPRKCCAGVDMLCLREVLKALSVAAIVLGTFELYADAAMLCADECCTDGCKAVNIAQSTSAAYYEFVLTSSIQRTSLNSPHW